MSPLSPRPKRGHPFLPENERRVMESFRYPLSLKIKLERYCAESGVNKTDAICEAIANYLNDQQEFSQKSQSVSGSSPNPCGLSTRF